MIAGIPGTGIGGIFYLLISLWMALRESGLTLGRKTTRDSRSAARRHAMLTASLIMGMWATGWFLGFILFTKVGNHLSKAASNGAVYSVQNVIKVTPIFFAFAALAGVYVSVHVMRLILGRLDSCREAKREDNERIEEYVISEQIAS